MLPEAWASKLSPYQIRFGKATVMVDVIDHHDKYSNIVIEKLSELKKQLTLNKPSVIGIGFEFDQSRSYQWLLLCAGDRCLMINFLGANKSTTSCYVNTSLDESLRDFFNNQNICFVGVNIATRNTISVMKCALGFYSAYAVEIGYLVARFRKNPRLLSYGSLEKLALEVGLEIEPRISAKTFDWRAKVFSDEDVKFAIYNAYTSYLIGDKLIMAV